MEVQQSYLYSLQDQDQITSITLLHQSPHNLKNHYDDYIRQMPHSRQSLVNAFTQQSLRISSSHMQPSDMYIGAYISTSLVATQK
jgi:hypothetical protein